MKTNETGTGFLCKKSNFLRGLHVDKLPNPWRSLQAPLLLDVVRERTTLECVAALLADHILVAADTRREQALATMLENVMAAGPHQIGEELVDVAEGILVFLLLILLLLYLQGIFVYEVGVLVAHGFHLSSGFWFAIDFI